MRPLRNLPHNKIRHGLDEFFSDQQGIIDNCVSGDNWSLETQFTWSLQHDRVNNTLDQPNNAINDSLVHPQ